MLKWIKRKMRMKEYCKTIEQLSAPYVDIINGNNANASQQDVERAYINWVTSDILADYKL